MALQIRRAPEPFLAHSALIWLCIAVRQHMSATGEEKMKFYKKERNYIQNKFASILGITYAINFFLLPYSPQIVWMIETLAARIAHVRQLAGVPPHMHLQRCPMHQLGVAYLALERCFGSQMALQMLSQIIKSAQLQVTHIALVRAGRPKISRRDVRIVDGAFRPPLARHMEAQHMLPHAIVIFGHATADITGDFAGWPKIAGPSVLVSIERPFLFLGFDWIFRLHCLRMFFLWLLFDCEICLCLDRIARL